MKIGARSVQWAQHQGIKNWYQAQTTSTNDKAKAEFSLTQTPGVFQIFLTDEQTLGRGQGSNTWVTPAPGDALLCTFAVYTTTAPQPTLTAEIGKSLNTSLQKNFSPLAANFQVKLPNDIYVFDKKLAGILVEVVQQGSQFLLLIGIGLNVFSSPAALDNSISLATALQQALLAEGTALPATRARVQSLIDTNWSIFLKSLDQAIRFNCQSYF